MWCMRNKYKSKKKKWLKNVFMIQQKEKDKKKKKIGYWNTLNVPTVFSKFYFFCQESSDEKYVTAYSKIKIY